MIGRLRHRLTLQEKSATPDAGGGRSVAWQDVAQNPQLWGRIAPLSAGEALRAMQLEDEITHEITIRSRDDVTAGMRLVRGNRRFRIVALSALDADSDDYLRLLVMETVT